MKIMRTIGLFVIKLKQLVKSSALNIFIFISNNERQQRKYNDSFTS